MILKKGKKQSYSTWYSAESDLWPETLYNL